MMVPGWPHHLTRRIFLCCQSLTGLLFIKGILRRCDAGKFVKLFRRHRRDSAYHVRFVDKLFCQQ